MGGGGEEEIGEEGVPPRARDDRDIREFLEAGLDMEPVGV